MIGEFYTSPTLSIARVSECVRLADKVYKDVECEPVISGNMTKIDIQQQHFGALTKEGS